MSDLQTYLDGLDAAHGLHLAGTRRAGAEGTTFAVEDPATGAVLTEVADGTVADARDAVEAAAAALPDWSATAPRARADILIRCRELILRDTERLTTLICAENGKSRQDAAAEVGYAAEFFRWYAEEAVRPGGDYGSSPAGGTRTIVTHRPVGVVALVTPWNFPAAMATRKLAPALAAGCTAVLKPAAETPLTAIALVDLMVEAGVPAGAVNLVPGTDSAALVQAWTDHPTVRKISFTGSTRVGRLLLGQAADRVLNASMELGGNAPFLVLPDADVDAAVQGAMIAKFRNGGQACTAANRFLVHASVAEEFTAKLGAEVETLAVGPATDGAAIGPLISAQARERVDGLVREALEAGARVAARVADVPAQGHFVAPAVLADVPAGAAVVSEEIFGPLAPVVTCADVEEMVALANDTEYGLAAYVYGELGSALRVAERLDTGMVGINRGLVSDPAAPFGGTKQSGIGREGARVGLEEYTETQMFSVAW